MSLLSTVTEALGYENLGGGYKQSTSRITSVPGRDASARQPLGVPNGAVPGVKNPIPTTTAQPGKKTNQRITYVRVQTSFHKDCGNVARVPSMEGDVVFVHRMDGTTQPPMGHDIARSSRIASITQLNEMFKNGNADPTCELTMGPNEDPRGLSKDAWVREQLGIWRGRPDIVAMMATLTAAQQLAAEAEHYKQLEIKFEFNPIWYRWAKCPTLARWAPDGVLASKEHDCVMDNSNPGEAYNVAVGGPTLTRNSSGGDYPQHFDDGVRTLDKVFVGLIATENRFTLPDGTLGANQFFSFKYKLFTSRQIAWAPLSPNIVNVKDMERSAPGGDNHLQPTADEFARMVQVWRIGSVLDNKSGMAPYRCATLNVVVEEWSLDMVQREYNEYFGESLALAVLPGGMAGIGALDLLAAGNAEITGNLTRLLVGNPAAAPPVPPALTAVIAAYDPSCPSEVAAWTVVDDAHAQDEQLRQLRNAANRTGVPTPGPPATGPAPRGHQGHLLGQRKYYAPGSAAIKALWAAFDALPLADQTALVAGLGNYAALGRAAALNGNSAFVGKLDAAQRGLLLNVVRYHALIVAAVPAMRLGEKIDRAIGIGAAWPVV